MEVKWASLEGLNIGKSRFGWENEPIPKPTKIGMLTLF